MLDFVDTHCHIHELAEKVTPTHDRWFSDNAERTAESVLAAAHAAAVNRFICIGTTLKDSELAVNFAAQYDEVFASVGIHPHEATPHLEDGSYAKLADLLKGDLPSKKIVAIGEIGLDYFYTHSPREDQIKLLRFQIELALEHDLPISFHVREAFADFWPIFDSYTGIRGVLHSFTDDALQLHEALSRGLFIGVNGIATFGKDHVRDEVNRSVPLDRLLLETDAPYLTPHPFRGKICESKHVAVTAEFLASLRGESLEMLSTATTANALQLFGL